MGSANQHKRHNIHFTTSARCRRSRRHKATGCVQFIDDSRQNSAHVPQQASQSNLPQPRLNPGDESIVIQIPNRFVGGLIGRAGSVMKVLTESSGARINFAKPDASAPPDATRACVISGTMQQVHAAQALITQEMAKLKDERERAQ